MIRLLKRSLTLKKIKNFIVNCSSYFLQITNKNIQIIKQNYEKTATTKTLRNFKKGEKYAITFNYKSPNKC